MSAVIVWFRRDLRVRDNPALRAAADSGLPIVALYVHAPEEEAPWQPGAASRWWLHHSLLALCGALRERGIELAVAQGNSLDALQDWVRRTGAHAVFWNRLYDPALVRRDQRIKQALRQAGVQAESFNANLWVEPWQVQTAEGNPYRVFTPFWRKVQAFMNAQPPLLPDSLPAHLRAAPVPHTTSVADLALLPRIAWDTGWRNLWQPGERGAHEALDSFLEEVQAEYAQQRDYPGREGTSRLSPHLHFGEISPTRIAQRLRADGTWGGAAAFARELGWREFSHHLLFHFPQAQSRPLDAAFQDFPWAKARSAALRAWQRGRTGIPIVDAGMRELWQTGWMHNRVRMIVASFLTKNLRYHWKHGARWFWDTLLDADLANNTQGWQWTAGCGADAAPYFRVFNPVAQGERFDPRGTYVRRYVPELRDVPDRWVHQPWNLPVALGGQHPLAGTAYAQPIVDLKASRERSLAVYREWRASVTQRRAAQG